MPHVVHLIFLIFVLSFSFWVEARTMPVSDSNDGMQLKVLINSLSVLAEYEEKYTFYGLASYYNNSNYYIISRNDLRKIDVGEVIELKKKQWLAVVNRLNVLLIQETGLSVRLDGTGLIVENPDILSQPEAVIKVVDKSRLLLVAPELERIRYVHLWYPFALLAKSAESALVAIQANIASNWGLTLIIFSVLLKLLLLPVGILTTRLQRQMSKVQSQLAPKLAEIKANYDGEEAHDRLMSAHKELGVTPFYTLKPMLGAFIQIPVLIAVFNALGEMPQLDGQAFLWIENLAYPDFVGHIPFVIPMFGDTVSLLPFVMTGITIFSTATFRNDHASLTEVKRQKRNLYLMSVAFFILFYPFPAAMVFYWAMNNFLHIFQQQVIKT